MTTTVQYAGGFLLTFTALTTAGILIGAVLSKRIDGDRLKGGFGWLVILLGVSVLLREIIAVQSG